MKKELALFLAGTGLVTACSAPNAPLPDAAAGSIPAVSAGITPTPIVESAGYITQVPDFGILDPSVRATQMVATAQSVASKGIEGLRLEGFPEKAFTSQRSLGESWSYDYVQDGAVVRGASSFECDSTLVNIPEMDAFVFVTATHCIAPEHQIPFFKNLLKSQFPASAIEVNTAFLDGIQLGGKTLTKDQFGIAYNIDPALPIETGGEGVATVFVSKSSFTPEELAELEADAITLNELRFDEVPADGSFYGMCTPGEIGGMPVVMEAGRIVANSPVSLEVGEFLSGHGCSGGGVFLKDVNQNAQLVSILAGSRPNDPTLNKVAVTYKLSALGANGFLQQITEAQYNWQNRGGQ